MAAQLAEAFDDDPVLRWIWPQPAQRRARMPLLFTAQLLYHHLPGGGVELITGDRGQVLGSAVWDPPGHWEPPSSSTVRSIPALLGALRARLPAALAVRAALQAAHPRTPHWYLNKIGTAAAVRGAGMGAALMVSRLQRCDQTTTDAYLECTREETIAFYERVGFRVTQQIQVSGGGPTLWGMLRHPE